jgi:hypothetical protein
LQIYDVTIYLSSLSHFTRECVANINHTPFERGENFLSTDNKIFFSKCVYWRIIQGISESTSSAVSRNFTKSADVFWGCLSFLLCRSVYKRVIKINYIRFERGEKALSFGKNVFFQHPSIKEKFGSTLCAITFASYVM